MESLVLKILFMFLYLFMSKQFYEVIDLFD